MGRIGFTASALGGSKGALIPRGVVATDVTGRPLTRYDAEETARVRAILTETGIMG